MKECNESKEGWTSYSLLCLLNMEAWYKLATGGKKSSGHKIQYKVTFM